MSRRRMRLALLLSVLAVLLVVLVAELRARHPPSIFDDTYPNDLHTLPTAVTPLSIDPRPICSHPRSIQIGTIDSQFQLSSAQLQEIVAAAVKEWQDATGRSWFTFGQHADLTINLLYDGRQELLMKAQRERVSLEHELAQAQLGANPRMDVVRQLLERLEGYRDIQAKLTIPFACGQHRSGPDGESIDLFAFATMAELHATILHELGHAIGLDHLPQRDALMYAVRKSGQGDTHLSQYDIEAALSLCAPR